MKTVTILGIKNGADTVIGTIALSGKTHTLAPSTNVVLNNILLAAATAAGSPSRTILPCCMTMTRWQSARTTLRSCEMKR